MNYAIHEITENFLAAFAASQGFAPAENLTLGSDLAGRRHGRRIAILKNVRHRLTYELLSPSLKCAVMDPQGRAERMGFDGHNDPFAIHSPFWQRHLSCVFEGHVKAVPRSI
jgi:hypothetical protein